MLVFSHDQGRWHEVGSLSAEVARPRDMRDTPAEPAVIGPFEALTPRQGFLDGVLRIKEWFARLIGRAL